MAQVVLDSGNLEAIVKDATGEGLGEPVKVEAKAAKPADDDALDAPDEDGITPREKQELTAKMLKAVGKRVRQAKEAEEFAAEQYNLRQAAERRVQELEAKAPPAQESVVKAKPERKDFPTDGEYINAVVQYEVTAEMAKRAAEQDRVAAEERQAQVLETAKTRIARAIELVPDFEDVTMAADVEVPAHVAGYMQESDMFAELGYFLAKNQDVVLALKKMTPARQLVEIGKIEGRLSPFALATDAKKTNGATPNSSTKNGTNGIQPSQAAPRDTTGEAQSAARRAAPVITPISTNGSSLVDADLENVRDHIAEFAKRKGVSLTRRQRH
jgi:hypothetical protein